MRIVLCSFFFALACGGSTPRASAPAAPSDDGSIPVVCRARAFAAGDAIVISSGRGFRDLRAFDPRQGTLRWTREIEFGFSGSVEDYASDEARLYGSGGQHFLVALDLGTGAVSWSTECDPAYAANHDLGRGPADCTNLARGGSHVAAIAVSASQVLIVRATDGALTHTINAYEQLGMSAGKLAFVDDVLLAGGGAGITEVGGIVAIDPESGANRWTLRLGEIVRDLQPLGGDLWARGHRGTLYRIRAGTLIATWGLRGGSHVSSQAGRLIVDTDEGVLAIDPARATEPDPELHLHGTAVLEQEEGEPRTSGLRVRVGGEVAVTAADGSFDLVTRARGGVYLTIEGDPPQSCDEAEVVFSDGSAPVHLTRRSRACREI